MMNKMKMFLVAIICCATVPMAMAFDLTPAQEGRIVGLFKYNPRGKFVFIKKDLQQVEYDANQDAVEEIIQSFLDKNPRASQLQIVTEIYKAIDRGFPGSVKDGLMPYLRVIVNDYMNKLNAMGY